MARIDLPEDQIAEFQQQLSNVLEFVEHLNEVEIPDGTEPFFGACESVNAIRDDVIAPSSTRETILANAPDTDGEFYLVPPVF